MRYSLAFALAVAFVAGRAPAEDRPAAVKAVIDKAIKAHGGLEKLDKFKMTRMTVKGTLKFGEGETNIEMVFTSELPDKFRNEMTMSVGGESIKAIEVFDGKKAWRRYGETTEELTEEDDLERIKQEAYHMYLESFVPLAKDKELEISALDDEKIDGKAAAGLKIMKKGQKEYRMYFDKESGLLVKSWYKGKNDEDKEVDAEYVYRDYKDVQGLKVAMKIVLTYDGAKYMDVEVSELKVGEKADEGTFKEP